MTGFFVLPPPLSMGFGSQCGGGSVGSAWHSGSFIHVTPVVVIGAGRGMLHLSWSLPRGHLMSVLVRGIVLVARPNDFWADLGSSAGQCHAEHTLQHALPSLM